MIDVVAAKTLAHEILRGSLWVHEYALVGSASWMPEPADVDYVVFFASDTHMAAFIADLIEGKWEICSEEACYDGMDWTAFRRGNLNFMLTTDRDWFVRFVRATEVCKFLQLKSKEARIAINQIIRDGKKAEDFAPKDDSGWGLKTP